MWNSKLNKHVDVVFFWIIHPENFVSELMTGMDRLEEYADEESPYTERVKTRYNEYERTE